MILLLLACSGPAPIPQEATPGSTLESCREYRDMPEVYGVCLVERVVSLHSPRDMDQVCGAAGTWADECRHEWVNDQARQGRNLRLEDLLVACGPADDCAFQVLDTHAEGDVLAQVAACERHVPVHVEDCVGHALARWILEHPPGEADAARVTAGLPKYPKIVGSALGRAAACGPSLACPADESVSAQACRTSRDEFVRDRWRCDETARGRSGATLP